MHRVKNNRMIRVLLVLLLVLFACAAFSCGPDAGIDVGKKIVARVNGQDIAFEDFARRFQSSSAGGRALPEDPLTLLQVKLSFLNQMVEKMLIEQEAARLRIAVSEAELEDAISSIRADYEGEGFEEMLRAKGVDFEDWKQQVSRGLLYKMIVNQVILPSVDVPEERIRAYYQEHASEFEEPETVHAYQIVTATEAGAREALDRLKRGADFQQLAREKSVTPERTKGGDLGYFARGQMPAEFDAAVFAMEPGGVSGVVKSDYGFHIFSVVDKRPPRKYSYTDVRERIEGVLKEEGLDREYEKWVQDLKAKAQIEIDQSMLGK